MEDSSVHTVVVKYTVHHSFANTVTRAYQVTGKAGWFYIFGLYFLILIAKLSNLLSSAFVV